MLQPVISYGKKLTFGKLYRILDITFDYNGEHHNKIGLLIGIRQYSTDPYDYDYKFLFGKEIILLYPPIYDFIEIE